VQEEEEELYLASMYEIVCGIVHGFVHASITFPFNMHLASHICCYSFCLCTHHRGFPFYPAARLLTFFSFEAAADDLVKGRGCNPGKKKNTFFLIKVMKLFTFMYKHEVSVGLSFSEEHFSATRWQNYCSPGKKQKIQCQSFWSKGDTLDT
jgi:hypothetical protein